MRRRVNRHRAFFSRIFSLPVAALGVAVILAATLASQPGSRLPRYLTFGLDRYANSNESAATRPLGVGSVESGLDCGKGGNPLADKHGIEPACISSAIESAEAGAGSYIRAWTAEASLAGERISASAEWYRKRYLGGNGNKR
jgi:hypothetical protein